MRYKKNDILIFMTKEPRTHVVEKFGGGNVEKHNIEQEPYYGFVKSVISANKGIYLMLTIKPMKGFYCIAETKDIVRWVDEDELPENERKLEISEFLEAPKVYLPEHNEDYATLTEQERCIALIKEAMQNLFPEIPVVEFEFNYDWFSKTEFRSTLDFFDPYLEQVNDSVKKKELLQLKNEILKQVDTARFKEYFTVNVGTPIEEEYEGRTVEGTSYFIAAVSKEFDEVYILSDINERSGFFRSLGPEFNELQEAVGYYRDKVMETV